MSFHRVAHYLVLLFAVSTVTNALEVPPNEDEPMHYLRRAADTATTTSMAAATSSKKKLINPKLGETLSDLYVRTTSPGSVVESPQMQTTSEVLDEVSHNVNNIEYIVVDVIGTNGKILRSALEKSKFKVISCYEHVCAVDTPTNRLKELSQISQVKFVSKSIPQVKVGRATTEGDAAMYASSARRTYGVDGTGLMVGVLSDSFNCLGGQAKDSRDNDLPRLPRMKILKDLSKIGCRGTDEGRAMMQIIHDVAPGAQLAFYTGFVTEADFANGIIELMNAGCDIIVDDVSYPGEPFYQDGIIAQAVNRVVKNGVAYFSAAGNDGSASWESSSGFVRSGVVVPDTGELHAFSFNEEGEPTTDIQIQLRKAGGPVTMVFQWASQYRSANSTFGSNSDLDIILYGENSGRINGLDLNTGMDPIETLYFDPSNYASPNSNDEFVSFDLNIALYSGTPPPHMKIIVFGRTDPIFEFGGGSSTLVGHRNAASCASVGAAAYWNTPLYGVSPPQAESDSSRGGLPVFYNTSGIRYQIPQVRKQPRFVGPDGGLTTFFGEGNRFFGTSAAAPHVAAVAALLLERAGGRKTLTPAVIYKTLQDSAIDMASKGFDYLTGYGFVDASKAFLLVKPK